MSNENVSLLNMFPDYEPPEALHNALHQAAIVAADIDPQKRSVEVCLHSDSFIPQRLLNQAADTIASAYGLQQLSVQAVFPADQLQRIEPDELMLMFMEENSMCRGSLAGARWEWEDTTLNIYLKANGKAVLEECMSAVLRKLQEKFSTNVHINIHAAEHLEIGRASCRERV